MPQNEALHLLLTAFFTVFGSLLGSFSNVVILRMASGKSVIFPPSACPTCNHQLHAIDLFPVFSWLFLRGKCRYCQVAISCQYPLVEAVIATIVGLSFFKLGAGSEFIVTSARLVIWFIASVIFFRNEVQKPEPFFWAVVYFVALNYPVYGCPFIDRRMLAIPFLATIVGFIASIRNQTVEIFKWGCLAFLLVFSLLNRFWFYPAIPVIILALLHIPENTKKPARAVFFALQLAGIFSNLF
ncbi:MAG: prepilin peptidase [Candidatus Riflebacteria bacterium]|nr:prepilin peptidase [Candidatus Riflebacteria bacterium]